MIGEGIGYWDVYLLRFFLNHVGTATDRRRHQHLPLLFCQFSVLAEIVKVAGPRRVAGAIFVEQRSPFMRRTPRHRPVNDGFRKEQRISRFDSGLDDVVSRAFKTTHFVWHGAGAKVTFVAAGNARKPPSPSAALVRK